jgi:hypothetical protein
MTRVMRVCIVCTQIPFFGRGRRGRVVFFFCVGRGVGFVFPTPPPPPPPPRARTIIAQTRPETIIVMLKKPAARKNSC